MHGPALTRVTGTTCPSALNTCVMPIFLPRIPGLISALPFALHLAFSYTRPAPLLLAKRLDLHIHARREIQFHQCIDRLLRRLENVEQALVRADFELLARLLVHMRRAQHGVTVLQRRQWNGT